MKRKLSFSGLVGAAVVSAFLAGIAMQLGGGMLAIIIFALAMLGQVFRAKPEHSQGVYGADVTVEVWQDHAEGTLFKENEFLLMSVDASQYVLDGKVVHIPQAGGASDVEESRSVFPATVTEREDDEVTYEIKPFTTSPRRIPNCEKYELSYNKRESVMGEDLAGLREHIADKMILKWFPSGATRIIRTTGEAVETHLDGTTGARQKFTAKDLKKAQLKLNKQGVLKTDRYCLMSSDMYDQFTDSLTESQERDFSRYFDAEKGVCGKLYGFTIMQRVSVATFTNAGTPVINAYGAVANADDNDAVLCWQKNAVERAVGDVTFFDSVKNPQYYGDVYSWEVRMGGRKRRADQAGLLAIVQAAA